MLHGGGGSDVIYARNSNAHYNLAKLSGFASGFIFHFFQHFCRLSSEYQCEL